jgi:hypothetical protein
MDGGRSMRTMETIPAASLLWDVGEELRPSLE